MGGWLLRVVRIGAETEEQLATAADERQRIDAWNGMHLSMERAEPDYSSRAMANDGHFPLPRQVVDLTAYLDDALKPTQKVNAASLYAIYHLAAVRAAHAYARAATDRKEQANLARTMLTEEAFALHFSRTLSPPDTSSARGATTRRRKARTTSTRATASTPSRGTRSRTARMATRSRARGS